MKLIHEGTGTEVKVGDVVTSFRGETATVSGWREPQHAASTGRIYVEQGTGWSGEYFPSVYSTKFVKE